jgi:hypothetical protein
MMTALAMVCSAKARTAEVVTLVLAANRPLRLSQARHEFRPS